MLSVGSQNPLLGCVQTCPGCAHRHLSADQSAELKSRFLARSLALWSETLSEIQAINASGRLSYRERTCLRARWQGGEWVFGFLDPATRELSAVERRVIGIPDCPVHSERIRNVLKVLSRSLPELLPLYYIVISGRILTLVLKAPSAPEVEAVNWSSLEPLGIEGVFFNFHPSVGNRVFSSKGWALVWGKEKSRTGDGLLHGPQSFQQLIPELYSRALDSAEEFLDPSAADLVIDLYCGLGASVARWRKRGASVLGVELGGESVRCAQENFPDVEFLQGKCSDRIPQIRKWLTEKSAPSQRTLVFVNPPRTGLESEVVDWLASDLRPEKIAYLSCSAGTLARDLEGLLNYRVEKLIPWDFFPQTHHVETLALLARTRTSRGDCRYFIYRPPDST